MVEHLVVTRLIPELEKDAGPGNTETDAPESTRKFLEERVYLRYRREKEELAGRKSFFHRPVSFPTRSRVACISGLCLHVSCETSRLRRRGTETSGGGERQLECWNLLKWWTGM